MEKLFYIAAIFGILSLAVGIYSAFDTDVIEITVTEKESITVGDNKRIENKYLIFTENEVFENTDSIIYGKYDSSDFQRKLKVGETYKVKVAGWRLPFFSMYRNIVKIY